MVGEIFHVTRKLRLIFYSSQEEHDGKARGDLIGQ